MGISPVEQSKGNITTSKSIKERGLNRNCPFNCPIPYQRRANCIAKRYVIISSKEVSNIINGGGSEGRVYTATSNVDNNTNTQSTISTCGIAKKLRSSSEPGKSCCCSLPDEIVDIGDSNLSVVEFDDACSFICVCGKYITSSPNALFKFLVVVLEELFGEDNTISGQSFIRGRRRGYFLEVDVSCNDLDLALK